MILIDKEKRLSFENFALDVGIYIRQKGKIIENPNYLYPCDKSRILRDYKIWRKKNNF